jgi:rod shape-determining protein MreD
MKWLSFAILAVLTVVLQTTVVQKMAIQSIWPDWMFVLAAYYALWGPWPEAAIAAWILGLLVDLQSLDRIGLHAFTYGAAAWGIMRLRQVVFRDHPLTQITLTLAFTLGVQLVVGLYRQWGPGMEVSTTAWWWPALFTAVYTAACAPYLHWLLIRLNRWTGLRASRRRLAPR